MTRDPRVYIVHILESADRIQEYIKDGEGVFQRERMIQDAVIRNFEIIGEAAKRVPEEYRSQHPDIPWRLMSGFRDVLIHGYEGVDLQRVWSAATKDLPFIAGSLRQSLPPLDQLERELSGDAPSDQQSDA